MSDAQYKVNRTDYSLIPDFIGYRNATPKVEKVITVEDNQITTITNRLTTWYLGSGQHSSERWIKMRTENEKTFIRNGVKAAQKSKSNIPKIILLKENHYSRWEHPLS